jgi:glycerophosphoryl diester phosphodiesterase
LTPPLPRPGGKAGPSLSRRKLLVMAGSGLLLAACSSPQKSAPSPSKSPIGSNSPAALPPTVPDPAPATIDELLQRSPFYLAHRGSGDEWVEHTLDAYRRSLDAGAHGVEISVNSTQDGFLVCHHDTDLRRTSGVDRKIADLQWSEIEGLSNDARSWLGPAAAPQPIPLLSDVLAALDTAPVIFIEDKQGTNTGALLDMLDAIPGSRDRFVWKQWAGAGQYAAAKARGYRTWGYFGPEIYGRFDELQGRFDLLGVPVDADEQVLARFVATGKRVIAWEVRRRSQRERLLRAGVDGLMCSNIPYLLSAGTPAHRDQFASGLRAPGDLPDIVSTDWSAQPTLDSGAGSLRLAAGTSKRYVLGSMGPASPELSTLAIELRLGSPTGGNAGISFGAPTDDPTEAGAQLLVESTGTITLEYAGQTASVVTAPSGDGEWIRIEISLSGGKAHARRRGASQSATVPFPGSLGYIALIRQPESSSVEFRRIEVA